MARNKGTTEVSPAFPAQRLRLGFEQTCRLQVLRCSQPKCALLARFRNFVEFLLRGTRRVHAPRMFLACMCTDNAVVRRAALADEGRTCVDYSISEVYPLFSSSRIPCSEMINSSLVGFVLPHMPRRRALTVFSSCAIKAKRGGTSLPRILSTRRRGGGAHACGALCVRACAESAESGRFPEECLNFFEV